MHTTTAPLNLVSAPAQRASSEVRVALWPILVVLYATLLPREVRLNLGSLTFFSDRLGLIIVLPYVIKKISEGAIRFVPPDFLILFAGIWMMVSMVAHYGLADGMIRGGSLAMDLLIGYYLARISFRSLRDVRLALIYFAPGLCFAGTLMGIESILHKPLVIPLAQRIFGALPFYIGGESVGVRDAGMQIRLGLMRAQGPFSHPILAGLYMASFLSIYISAGLRGWPKWVGVFAAVCSLFSVSSAAILGISLIIILLIFDRSKNYVKLVSWPGFFVALTIIIVILEIFTSNGAVGVLTRMALDPTTAYYRRLIWQFGSVSVEKNPLFGIGFAGYDRPIWMVSESIDAHWLLLAVRFGLPEALAVFVAMVMSIYAVSIASLHAPPVDSWFFRGIAIALGAMSVMMFTVTLWGAALNLFTLLLGGSVACAQRSFISRPSDRPH